VNSVKERKGVLSFGLFQTSLFYGTGTEIGKLGMLIAS